MTLRVFLWFVENLSGSLLAKREHHNGIGSFGPLQLH
jgi:hypothetical protein